MSVQKPSMPLLSRLHGTGPLAQVVRGLALCGIGIALLGLLWHQMQPGRSGNAKKHGTLNEVRGVSHIGMPIPLGFGHSGRGRRGFWHGGHSMHSFHEAGEGSYIANLADTVGPYTVSVQEVWWQTMDGMDIYRNPQRQVRTTTDLPVGLALQVVSPHDEDQRRLRSFAQGLIVTDETGYRLHLTGMRPPVNVPNGFVQMLELDSASPNARRLSIEGEIPVNGPPGWNQEGGLNPTLARMDSLHSAPTTLKFHIANVPLPGTLHIFGVAAACALSPRSAPRAARLCANLPGQTARLIAGSKVNALRALFPPQAPEPGPLHLPTRLMLLPDIASHFDIPVADEVPNGVTPEQIETLRCTLTPTLGPGGELTLRLTLRAANTAVLETQLHAWDNAPLILVLPGNRAAQGVLSRPIAVWLHLFLDMSPPERPPDVAEATPFAPHNGGHRGAIEGRVFVGEEPFGLGYGNFELTRTDGQGHDDSPPARLTQPLDRDGNWRLANLAPGSYRIRLLDVTPYTSFTADPITPQAYLRRRYGLTEVRWQNQTQYPILVKPDIITTLRPWRVEGK